MRLAALSLLLLAGCNSVASNEAAIRRALQAGSVRLPAGVIEIHSELALPDGARDVEISGPGSILRAADDFRGRGIFTSKSGLRIAFRDFIIDGNRAAIEHPAGFPASAPPSPPSPPTNPIL